MNPTLLKIGSRKGGMMIFMAVVMVIFLIGAAFCVDIAYMHMVKAEMRTAVDAASRAGAETLIRTQDPDAATTSAHSIAEQNSVAGENLTLHNNDIQFGQSYRQSNGKFGFDPNSSLLNSVRVVGRRTASAPDGSVHLFMGNIFGVETFEPLASTISAGSVRDVALVLDRSGSMESPVAGSSGDNDDSLTRINALKTAVETFISEIENTTNSTNISLTIYSDSATRIIPLTDNFQTIRSAVSSLSGFGSTNILQALQFGSDSLDQDPNRRAFAERTIVLMTDGNFNTGGDPLPSAVLANTRGHVIHTITFSAEANQAAMTNVAATGNGMHIHADNAADLNQAFQDIARDMAITIIQ